MKEPCLLGGIDIIGGVRVCDVLFNAAWRITEQKSFELHGFRGFVERHAVPPADIDLDIGV